MIKTKICKVRNSEPTCFKRKRERIQVGKKIMNEVIDICLEVGNWQSWFLSGGTSNFVVAYTTKKVPLDHLVWPFYVIETMNLSYLDKHLSEQREYKDLQKSKYWHIFQENHPVLILKVPRIRHHSFLEISINGLVTFIFKTHSYF